MSTSSDPRPSPPGTLTRARGWLREHPGTVDLVGAVALFLLTVVMQPVIEGIPVVASLLLGAAQTLPLAARRSRPLLAFAVVSLGCLVAVLVLAPVQLSNVGFLFALYAVAAFCSSDAWRIAALVIGIVASYVATWSWERTLPVSSEAGTVPLVFRGLFIALVAVVTWMAGNRTGDRRRILDGLRLQNESLRRERDQRALLAARDERTRIAREMHDVVAHALAVVVVQADGAAYAARHGSAWEREQAADTLETIAATAREALSDTRALVGVLREEGSDASEVADYVPTVGLADLDALVARVRESGHQVALHADPAASGSLSREGGLAAYRVVQEGLTNVLKHAGPAARTEVSVRRSDGHVLVTVEDDGRGSVASDGAGHGLIGMQERIRSVGGTLTTGPLPRGGYRVHAAIPLPQSATRGDA